MVDIVRPVYGEAWASIGEKVSPTLTKIQGGWIQEMMPYQWENFLQNRQDTALLYVLQKGVPEWDASQEYIAGKSVVTYQTNLYISVLDSTNVLPTVQASWKKLNPSTSSSGLVTVAGGGTGASTASDARTNLGLGTIATSIAPTSNGVVVRSAADTLISRSIVGTTNNIVVANGDGVAGNISINTGSNVALLNTDSSWTSTGSIRLPAGSTSQQGTATPGRVRFNLETDEFHGAYSDGWKVLARPASAEQTPITDIGNFYTAPNVEGALQEVGLKVSFVKDAILSYPDYASASAAAATLPDGQVVQTLNDGFAYTVSSGVLGQKRPAFSFPALPTLGKITAAMREGKVVKVACYGDSTTDGNETTGWVGNPVVGGVPVGTTDHETRAPNAWPAKLKATLRLMFKNNNIQVWNAGYSGQRLDNGWALSNYDKAVTDNPAYGVPDICFIAFGLNDITASDVYQNHYRNTYSLCVKLIASGTLPVLLTCDAFQRNDPAVRDSEEATQVVDSAKMAVAKQLNIPILEVGAAMRQWASCNSSGYTWATLQPDDLHFRNLGHAFKAGFVASILYPDLIKPFDSMEVAAQDPRWQLDSSKAWTKYATSNPKSGRNYYANAVSGDELMSGWVWNTRPDMRVIFLEVDGGGSQTQPQRGAYTVLDTVSGIVSTVTSTDNSARVDALKCSDIPVSVGVLPVGLSRISSSVKVGAEGQSSYSCDLLFRKVSANPPSIGNMRLPSSVGYKMTGTDPVQTYAFFAPERYYCDLPSNAPKLLTITARMNQSGIILWHSKGFSNTDRSLRAGLSIFLNATTLYLSRATGSPTASTEYSYSVIATCPSSSVVLDSDGYLSITVELDFVSGVPNIKIKQAGTTLIDASCAGRALPLTGYIGGLIHRSDGVKPVIKEMNWQEL